MAMNYRKSVYIRDEQSIKNDIENITDLYGGAEKRLEEASKNGVKNIDVNLLQESSLNHFHAISGEEWDEFVASIKSHGILTPITVRPIADGKYEILAGHNRVRGAKTAGITEVPAIIKDVDDVEASIIIADTNLQREEVTDLEKGWAYRNIFEAINRKGKNQYTSASGQSDQKQNDSDESASGQSDQKQNSKYSSEIIAEKYGIGEKTVRRKIRLTYLIYPLYTCYENKLITQEVAEQLSYLRKNEQALAEGLISAGLGLTPEIAKVIRKASEDRHISDVDMQEIAGTNIKQDTTKPSRPKRYRIDEALFPPTVKKGLREDYIVKALTYIRDNNIEV